MSSTYSKIKLTRGKADEKRLNTQSPMFDFDQKYNFKVEPFPMSNPMTGFNMACVSFDSTYDNKDEFLSKFFLDPEDAITLGSHLIRTALRCRAYNDPILLRDDYFDKLLLDIKLGYVDTLVVKYHKRYVQEFPVQLLAPYSNYHNRFYHLYNIYPIYKDGIKNNHFNFNIPLNITDYTSYTGETPNISLKDKIRKIFDTNIRWTSDDIEDKDIEELKRLNSIYPGLINIPTRKLKIKLVNFRKIAKEDMEESIQWNTDRKVQYEKEKEEMTNVSLDEAKERINRSNRIRDLIQSTPKEADGSIDFNKVMQSLVSTVGDPVDMNVDKPTNNPKIINMKPKED